ncbi:uncharacterized protein Hap1MRO34_004254 [Clarias gariepinus]
MPIECSVLGCTNRFVKGSDIRFYRFPISKPKLAEKWIRSLGQRNFLPTTNSCLCSEHFLPNCFRDFDGKQFLREDAVPTIFAHTAKQGADGKKGSRSGTVSEGGKQKTTKDKRQVSKDTGQKGKAGNDASKRRGGAKVQSSERQVNTAKSNLYDSRGLLISCGRDLCDCLDVDCMGCFYPCPECSSRKCGVECRCNRKWLYEHMKVEGGEIIQNMFAS